VRDLLRRQVGALARLARPRGSAPAPRVLFIYRFCGAGGVETATLAKAAALRQAGIEAAVMFAEYYGQGGRRFAGQPHVTIGLPRDERLLQLLEEEVDAAVIIDYPDLLDRLARHGLSTPIVYETHSAIPSSLDSFHRPLANPLVRLVVVPSAYNAQLIRERLDPPAEIVRVPNPVDAERFSPRGAASLPAAVRDVRAGTMILWVGRLEDEKNPAELVAIVGALLRHRHDVHFLIVGDTWNYDDYRRRLEELMPSATREAITFVRTVDYDDMPALYRAVRDSGGCLLSTSAHESAPMTFVEAMLTECPILSSDVGGVAELVHDSINGRLYKTGDVAGAVAILLELLDPANKRSVAQMAQRGREYAARVHSPAAVARQYGRLLRGLAG
jgi:L-malate glycosyltransferase